MASCEEMLMGIFDTRNRIVRQLKEQQQLFDQALRSSLLLRGIQPPAWLNGARATTGIRDRCHPGSNEDLVPGLLIPPHKQTANSSFGFCTHNKSEALYSTVTHDFSKEFITENMSALMRRDIWKPNGNEICSDNPNGNPPPETAAMPYEVCIAPDRSLEKITRSRSRQRALEQRNSEKKREGDEKKAAAIENTGRVASSRFAYRRPDIRVSSVEIAESAERQPIHGSMLTIQPKELMFDDVEDCNKDKCPDLDEKIFENELLEKNKNMQSRSTNLTNVEEFSEKTQREKVASVEGLSANKISHIRITFMDASQGNMMHDDFSSAEQLPEVRKLVNSPNIQPPEDSSCYELQQRIDDSMSNKKASEVSFRKSTNSSRKEVTDTTNKREVEEGDLSEVNMGTTRFSSNDHLDFRKLSNSANLLAREQGASVGTERRITRSMSSCFLNGGGSTRRQMASTTAKYFGDKSMVQKEATSYVSSDGNQNRGVSSSRKQLQKVDEFVDSNSLQVRDLDFSLKEMVQETMGVAPSCVSLDGNQDHGVTSSRKQLFDDEIAESAERQPIHGSMLTIQPKELMFDDVEDCNKDKCPDLDEKIFENELLEKNKNMQSRSANLTNVEVFSEQTQREKVASVEGLSANKISHIRITFMDASQGNMMHDDFSSAEQLPEARKLVNSPNIQPPEDSSCYDLQQRTDDSMSNKKASEVGFRKSTNSSRKEVTDTTNKREVEEGDLSEVNLETTRFSSNDHLDFRKLSNSANLIAREQGASVGTERRITRSMSSCFLNGGGRTQRQMASTTATYFGDKSMVQKEDTSYVSSDGNQNRGVSSSRKQLQKVDEFVDSNSLQVRDLDFSLKEMVQETMGVAPSCVSLDGNQDHGVASSRKQLQKVDDFVDSTSFHVRDLNSSPKDMVQETIGIAPCDTVYESTAVSNISPKYCKRGSKAFYFLRSHSLTHQRNVDASHIARSNGSKARHYSQGSKLSERPMKNVDDLSRPAYWMQPNNDNQLNPKAITSLSIMGGDLQIQNEVAESASEISEVVVESHDGPPNQVHAGQLNLDSRFDGVEVHRSTEQTDTDRPQSLPLSRAACSPVFSEEVEYVLEDQSASMPKALQKTLVASPHGTEFEEQVRGDSDLSLMNQQGSGLNTVVLDNKCSNPTDDRLQIGETKPQPMNVDYSVVEKASCCGSEMHQSGDAEKDFEEEQPCSPGKGFVSPSCHTSRTSFRDPLDSSDKHSSVFGVDDSLPVFEGFSVGLPTVCEEPPVVEGSKLYDYLDFSSFKTTALDGPQICKSTSFLTPRSNASSKNKIHSTPDVYQSLPNGFLEHTKSSLPCIAEDLKHVGTTAGEYGIFHEIFCKSGLRLMDGSSLTGSYSGSTFGSDAKLRRGIRSPAASTPAAGKFSERNLLKSNDSGSEKQFKNPELTCFRIEEEEISMNDENGHVDLDDVSEVSAKRNCSRMNMPENALANISMSHCGSSDFNDEGEAFLHGSSTKGDDMQIAFAGKESGINEKYGFERKNVMDDDKENRYLSFCAGKSEKVSSLLPKRTSKPKLSGNVRRENGSQTANGKDRKLNNIVANVSSFIPLIQQKKPVPAKRDVKVKALEAAEAAKRLEEKKEIERKMRKETAKLERKKLMLENLKQMEEQRRREEEKKQKRKADLAKRQQREEEEKREKERKRKLIEESRKQLRLAEEKELQHKVERDEFKRKEAKRQKVEKGREGIGQIKAAFPGTGKVSAGDAAPSEHVRGEGEAVSIANDKLIGTNSLASIDKGCSSDIEETEEAQYEMSPYRGSDDEDEEDDVIRRKFIPSWARKENLISILCRQQHVDPDGIFPSVKGCNLNEVLGSNNFSRYRDRNGRGESGCWMNDSFTQQEEYQYKLKMGYVNL